ncbi:MAG TPA: hypothetical protein VH092_18230 [Urbifossiella sp.]|jgi:pimeloyl-ACP methyl ester carboxylesterase|nr:hypothetical protein [Urbifossiella sp.]
MTRTRMPDVVVVIPGILGSALARGGREVWGLSPGAGFRALASLGGSIGDLALHADTTDPDFEPGGVRASALLPDLHLIPYLWKVDGYGRLTQSLRSRFDLTPGKNYFEFPYDWRRDNRLAAGRLHRLAGGWLRDWRESSGNDRAKLIIVAHSMGGLVARYFLEVLDGWRDAKALITFGTPHRGSLNALRTLVQGLRKGPAGILDLSAMARSFPSLYQLLPTYPCVVTPEGGLARVSECPALPNVSDLMIRDAAKFHEEIRAAVARHQLDDAYRERRYRILSVVGTYQETVQSAQLEPDGDLVYLYHHADRNLRGDGTVPRVSATPLEESRGGTETYVATCHASLQNSGEVLHHISEAMAGFDLDLASPIYRAGAGGYRVGLRLEDAYYDDEPVAIGVITDPVPSPPLVAKVTDAQSGSVLVKVNFPAGRDGWVTVEIPPLPVGSYRCVIESDAPVQPAADIFAVVKRP